MRSIYSHGEEEESTEMLFTFTVNGGSRGRKEYRLSDSKQRVTQEWEKKKNFANAVPQYSTDDISFIHCQMPTFAPLFSVCV